MALPASLGTPELMSIAAALGWASGLRLYAVLFLTGLAGHLGWVPLPGGLQWLQQPLVLGASGLMLAAEFFADKIPGFDSFWDLLHTFVRIPAGAALAAAVFGGDEGTWAMAAAVLGGSLAATAHVAKTTTRAAVNTSPEPFSNWGLSLAGDAAVPAMLWLAWAQPMAAAVALGVAVVVMLGLTVWLLRHGRALLRGVARRLRGREPS
jgi:heme exporter protein D